MKLQNNNNVLRVATDGICFLLTAAEATMTRRKFKNFRKIVLDYQHGVVEPKLRQEIANLSVEEKSSSPRAETSVSAESSTERKVG